MNTPDLAPPRRHRQYWPGLVLRGPGASFLAQVRLAVARRGTDACSSLCRGCCWDCWACRRWRRSIGCVAGRSRGRFPVSFSGSDQRRPRQGGRIFQRLQTPLTFFLELLAIAAIVTAAAGPAFTRSRSTRPLMLVLDDSYSMQAGGDASTRRRASERLLDEFRRTDYVARVILAGAESRLLGSAVRTPDQLQAHPRSVDLRGPDRWLWNRPSRWQARSEAFVADSGGQRPCAQPATFRPARSNGGVSVNREETLLSRPPRAIHRPAAPAGSKTASFWK